MYQRAQIFLFISFPLLFSNAQVDSPKSTEDILSRYINSATIEKENSELYDLIEYYVENPIDLNNANKSALMKLPFVNIEEVDKVIKYRDSSGRLFSFGELKSNKNISIKFVELLELFTYIKTGENRDTKSPYEKYQFKLRSRINYDMQNKEGYNSGYFKGSPIKVYNRLKLNADSKVFVGGLIEKDAGDRSYFDFYSFYFQFNNIISGISFLAGFYTMEFGQGLAMWSPYAFSKSSDATNSIIKRSRNISPYASAGEFGYLNGLAINYSTEYLSLTPFYSIQNKENYFNSKGNIVGVSLSLSPVENINFSTLYYQRAAESTIIPSLDNGSEIKKYFSFSYEGNYNKLFLTGEFSIFKNSVASINTLQLSIYNNFIMVASVRNYPSEYTCLFAKGFGESNRTSNEFGLYFGIKWKTNYGTINFYIDQFSFPHESYSIPLPSNGNEVSISYAHKPTQKVDLYFRYFKEMKEEIEEIETSNKIVTRTTDKFRFEFLLQFNRALRLKSRIELLQISRKRNSKSESGLLLFQDFQYKVEKRLAIYGRVIFFQTESFASRIYEFENDLIGVMTNQPLWGIGLKWYLLIRANLFRDFQISAKYAELYKPNDKYLGSNHNLIDGNIDNKISVQIDYSF